MVKFGKTQRCQSATHDELRSNLIDLPAGVAKSSFGDTC